MGSTVPNELLLYDLGRSGAKAVRKLLPFISCFNILSPCKKKIYVMNGSHHGIRQV